MVWLNSYADQLVPIVLLLILRGVVGVADKVLKFFGGEKKDPMQVGTRETLAPDHHTSLQRDPC